MIGNQRENGQYQKFFGLILATNTKTNKRPHEMTYVSAQGAYMNEYSILTTHKYVQIVQ